MAPKPSQPSNLSSASESPNLPSKRNRSSRSDDQEVNSTPRKQHRRVSKACERCRLKKTKCNGEMPCQRCTGDGVACCEGARKKSGSKTVAESCVELLEYQQTKLIAGHLKMYQIMVETGTWSFGEVRRNGRGVPVVHDILEKLGVMRCSKDLPNGFPESPDENRVLRGQLEATRDQKKHREEHEYRKKSHREEAPPSLVHTDRESSVDSSRSSLSGTTKNSVEMEHKYTPPALTVNTLPNFQHQNELLPSNKCTSFKYSLDPSDSKNLSVMTLPSSANINLASDICGNAPITDRLKNMPSYHEWNRIGLNSSAEPAPTQFMTQVTAPFSDVHVYNAMNNHNTTFNTLPMLGPEYLQPININMGTVPTVMKYSFDPYMG